jgi:hypothetical protein
MKQAGGIKNRRARSLTLALVVAICAPIEPAYAANNTECSKAKKTKSVKGTKYKCVSDGTKLIWADKKVRKKIANAIKKEIEQKKKESMPQEKAEEKAIEPPKKQTVESSD